MSSALTEHQAFRCRKNAYDILFHPETTLEIIFSMTRDFADEAAQAEITPAQIFGGWAKVVI